MTAKIVAMVLVSLAGTAVALYGVLEPIFGLPMRGSALLFFAMVALYSFALSGLGLVLASLARSSAQVGLLVVLTVLPMLNLSGLTSPVEGMPQMMRWGVELSPLYHFAHAAYGIAFRGEGLLSLWRSAASMLGLGLVLIALGLWRFRAQFA
jgi:ABC-2 type transport system permease protein